jgi:hypothetical protein
MRETYEKRMELIIQRVLRVCLSYKPYVRIRTTFLSMLKKIFFLVLYKIYAKGMSTSRASLVAVACTDTVPGLKVEYVYIDGHH